jgi:hypothetical protein
MHGKISGQSLCDFIQCSYKLSIHKIMAKTRTVKIGRDSGSGKFIPVKKANKDPKHTQVETIKVPVKKKGK